MAERGHVLDRSLSSLIQNISMVVPAMDDMRQMDLLTDEQYELVKNKATSQEQMRELYRHVKGWGYTEKTTVYECLKKNNRLVIVNVEQSQMRPDDDRSHAASVDNPMCSAPSDNQPSVDHQRKADTSPGVSTDLQTKEHSIHEKTTHYYCTKDGACFRRSCCTDGDHQTKSVPEKLLSQADMPQKTIQRLQEHEGVEKEKTDDITKRICVLFRDCRRQMDSLEKRILNEISRQEEQVSLSVSDLIRKLQVAEEELCSQTWHIEELRTTSDPLTALFCKIQGVEPGRSLRAVRDVDVGLISATFHSGLSDIITGIKRGIYTQEISHIVLDINTAENHVHISEDLKTASWSQRDLQRPDTADRFDHSQVLSCSRFSLGQYYWEVETSDTGAWRVGVSYSNVGRKGRKASVGSNECSWSLCRWINGLEYAVLHNEETTQIHDKISSRRFGVYLDYEAGRLSFYELSDPVRHLHTFTATFTEPLHATIYVWDRECDKGCWVKIRSYEN